MSCAAVTETEPLVEAPVHPRAKPACCFAVAAVPGAMQLGAGEAQRSIEFGNRIACYQRVIDAHGVSLCRSGGGRNLAAASGVCRAAA